MRGCRNVTPFSFYTKQTLYYCIYMIIDLYVPDKLSDITLRQYQKFAKLNTEENENTNFLLHKMVEIFCNLDLKDIAKIRFNHVTEIIEDLNKVFEQKPDLTTTIDLYGVTYGFIPKLDDMTLGEYIDLDNTLSDWGQMHKAMAVLYRRVILHKKDKYQIEEYKGSDDADIFKDMPLDVVMGSLVFFYRLSNELLKTTLNYLSKEMNKELTMDQKATLESNGVGINQFMESLKEMSPNLTKSLN